MALKTGGTGNLQTLPGAQNLPGFNVRMAQGESASEQLESLRAGMKLGSDIKGNRISRSSEAETKSKEESAKILAEQAAQQALKSDEEARTHESSIKRILAEDDSKLAQSGVDKESAVQKLQTLKDNAERTRNTNIATAQRAQILAEKAAEEAPTEAAGIAAETANKASKATEQRLFREKTAESRLGRKLNLSEAPTVQEGDGFRTVSSVDPETGETSNEVIKTPQKFDTTGRPTGETRVQNGIQQEQVQYQDGNIGWRTVKSGGAKAGSVNPVTGEAFTEGEKAADRDFAKEVSAWNAGSGAGIQSDIKNIRDSATKLRNLSSASGTLPTILGAASSNITGGASKDLFKSEAAVDALSGAKTAINKMLKPIFGANMAKGEGDRLFEATLNPAAGEETNAVMLERLADSLEASAKQNSQGVKYFTENGTIAGFDGGPSIDSVILDVQTGGAQPSKEKIKVNENMEREGSKGPQSHTEVTSKEEMDNLPSSVQYFTWNGKKYPNPKYK